MKRTILVVTILVCLSMSIPLMAWTQYKDGGTHNISSTINDDVWVDYQTPGMNTTVNLNSGGSIGNPYKIQTFEDSQINIQGGSADYMYTYDNSRVSMTVGHLGYLYAYSNSMVTTSGGSIGKLYCYGTNQININAGSGIGSIDLFNSNEITVSSNAHVGRIYAHENNNVTISEGEIYEIIAKNKNSQVTINGGIITGSVWGYNIIMNDGYVKSIISDGFWDGVVAFQTTITGGSVGWLNGGEGGQITIFDGVVNDGLEAWNGNTNTIFGGSLLGEVKLQNEGSVLIYGSNFAIDNNPVSYGNITSILGGNYLNEPNRLLTGITPSGGTVNCQFKIGDFASITLAPVPEPTSLLALSTFLPGILFLIRRR